MDFIELSHGRDSIMIWEDAGHVEDIPRLWLEHYREGPIDERVWNESDVTGPVWLHPEDLPALIAQSSDGGVSWPKELDVCDTPRVSVNGRPAKPIGANSRDVSWKTLGGKVVHSDQHYAICK